MSEVRAQGAGPRGARSRGAQSRGACVLAAALVPAAGAIAQTPAQTPAQVAVQAPAATAAAGVAHREATLHEARTLAWAGRFADACVRYDAWLRVHPDDAEAQLARARTLAWAHRYAAAAAAYAALRRSPDTAAAREAAKGEAQLTAWRGDLSGAAAAWRTLAAAAPEDAEVWVGLGQTLRWAGDPAGADAALRRAAALAPARPDVAEQRRWLWPDLVGTATPATTHLSDSDGNRVTVARLVVALPPLGPATTTVTASRLGAALGGVRSASTRAVATVRVPVGAAAVSADLGAAYLAGRGPQASATSGGAVLGVAGLRGTLRLANGSSFTLGAARAPFDETARLAAARVWTGAAFAAADLRAGPVGAALSGEWASVHGASGANRRTSGTAELRGRVPLGRSSPANGERPAHLDLFGAARAHGYARATTDGYFAPRAMTLAEVGARLHTGGALGWQVDGEAAAGRQRVALWDQNGPDGRAALRGGVGVAYRFAPGAEVGGRATRTTASSPGLGAGGAAYVATTVALEVRVPLRTYR